MKKLLLAAVCFVAFVAVLILNNHLEAPRAVLHVDTTYTVTKAQDGILICKSEPFSIWLFKSTVATSVMKWENLPSLAEGRKFQVTQRLDNTTVHANDYVTLLN